MIPPTAREWTRIAARRASIGKGRVPGALLGAPLHAMTETDTLLTVIAVLALVIAAVMMVIAWSAYTTAHTVRRLERRANEFFDAWQPAAGELRQSVQDFTEQSGELLSRLNGLSALLHKQALKSESAVQKVAEAASRNVEEVDAAVRAVLARIRAATEALERAVRVPVTKVRAVAVGLREGVRQYSRGASRDPGRVSTDEEMFI